MSTILDRCNIIETWTWTSDGFTGLGTWPTCIRCWIHVSTMNPSETCSRFALARDCRYLVEVHRDCSVKTWSTVQLHVEDRINVVLGGSAYGRDKVRVTFCRC